VLQAPTYWLPPATEEAAAQSSTGYVDAPVAVHLRFSDDDPQPAELAASPPHADTDSSSVSAAESAQLPQSTEAELMTAAASARGVTTTDACASVEGGVDQTHHSLHARPAPRVQTSGLLAALDVSTGTHVRFADSDGSDGEGSEGGDGGEVGEDGEGDAGGESGEDDSAAGQGSARRKQGRSRRDAAWVRWEEAPAGVSKKYWYQRYRLFSRFDEDVRMDEEGWYSATPEQLSMYQVTQHIQVADAVLRTHAHPVTGASGGRTASMRLIGMVQERTQAERCACNLMVDAFAGVGGNTVQFARTCGAVLAADLDGPRLALAQHNVAVYQVHRRSLVLQPPRPPPPQSRRACAIYCWSEAELGAPPGFVEAAWWAVTRQASTRWRRSNSDANAVACEAPGERACGPGANIIPGPVHWLQSEAARGWRVFIAAVGRATVSALAHVRLELAAACGRL
jgi:hypothetical protein